MKPPAKPEPPRPDPERRPEPPRPRRPAPGLISPRAGALRAHLARTMPGLYAAATRRRDRCDHPHCGDPHCQLIDRLNEQARG